MSAADMAAARRTPNPERRELMNLASILAAGLLAAVICTACVPPTVYNQMPSSVAQVTTMDSVRGVVEIATGRAVHKAAENPRTTEYGLRYKQTRKSVATLLDVKMDLYSRPRTVEAYLLDGTELKSLFQYRFVPRACRYCDSWYDTDIYINADSFEPGQSTTVRVYVNGGLFRDLLVSSAMSHAFFGKLSEMGIEPVTWLEFWAEGDAR